MLVVPFADGIGDFIMMLPLLDAVRHHYPAAAITVAASARSALLLDETQAAALTIRTPSWIEGEPGPRGGPLRKLVPQSLLASVAATALRLELGRFDRTLNFFLWWERGVDFARYWTPQVPPQAGATHTVDCLAGRLEQEVGERIPDRRPRLRLRQEAARWAERWWCDQALAGRPVVALIPTTNMRIKRWPTAYWLRLARDLADTGAVPLLFLPPGGDPIARALGALPCPPLVAQVPLDRAVALLARCDLAVGVDTGLLHIAAAVGTRYVGLFGPTNPDVTGPYDRALGTALVAPFAKTRACGGCWRQFKYIDDTCRTLPGSSCLAALPAEQVLAACFAELRRAGAVA